MIWFYKCVLKLKIHIHSDWLTYVSIVLFIFRTNPVDVLIAMKTYAKGQLKKDKKKKQNWKPNKDVLDALETALYEALRVSQINLSPSLNKVEQVR